MSDYFNGKYLDLRRAIVKKVDHDPAKMGSPLTSTQDQKGRDHCCGIHGAARARKGLKKGTATARRRWEKRLVNQELEKLDEGEQDGSEERVSEKKHLQPLGGFEKGHEESEEERAEDQSQYPEGG